MSKRQPSAPGLKTRPRRRDVGGTSAGVVQHGGYRFIPHAPLDPQVSPHPDSVMRQIRRSLRALERELKRPEHDPAKVEQISQRIDRLFEKARDPHVDVQWGESR